MNFIIRYKIDGTITLKANDIGEAEQIFSEMDQNKLIDNLILDQPLIESIEETVKSF